ncbi:gamma-glutamyltransferase [Microvirga sp. W0021]|uniref:Glutathione hydrolase proenzyme n=1 Tax=Hohaiivirga grylli TaxID=3133970 RepID=A0ABV0BI96_9HYPH
MRSRSPTQYITLRGLLLSAAFAVAVFKPITGSTQTTLAPAPEASSGRNFHPAAHSKQDMIAAANPLAAAAGREILAEGGSAVDAAIAAQMVLNLVEPQSSGIGGGLFLVHWDKAEKKVSTIDGRETAPSSAKPDLFMMADGKPMPFYEAVVGGRSVGTPGTLRALELAHKKWGKLPWERLFQPAIKLAEDGFTVSPRLSGAIARDKYLAANPVAKAYFYDETGKARDVGFILKNPALAKTFKAIAEKGADVFYSGDIAKDIVNTVTSHPKNSGFLSLSDLKAYKAIEREALCSPYRDYVVCSMPPPSSGGIAVLQALGILQRHDMTSFSENPGPNSTHWISEAERLAFADRNLYVGDPGFVDVPSEGLLDKNYLASRAELIDPKKSMGKAKAGTPPMKKTMLFAPSDGIEHGTSHLAIIDRFGNAVSMTTTIEDGFGSRQMTKSGFLLNNELTDFNFSPTEEDKPVANRVEPGKRPRSSMAPAIVFDKNGDLYAVVGSPGGSQIIPYVTKTLVALLDWKFDPQVAVDLPNAGSRNGPTELEAGTEAEGWKAALEALGHEVKLMEQNSGIQAIVVTPEGFTGGADSRREGVAIGN